MTQSILQPFLKEKGWCNWPPPCGREEDSISEKTVTDSIGLQHTSAAGLSFTPFSLSPLFSSAQLILELFPGPDYSLATSCCELQQDFTYITYSQTALVFLCVFGRYREEKEAETFTAAAAAGSQLGQQDKKQKHDLSFNCAKWQIAYRQGCPLGKPTWTWLFLIS